MATPVKGYPISTPYNKSGRLWSGGKHTGVDYAAPTGTPVYAAQDGVVIPATWGAAYGNAVIVDQKAIGEGAGRIAGGWAIYAHLSKVHAKAGQVVKKGDLIGEVGNTGNSTGAHLHYEVRTNKKWSLGRAVNPMPFIEV